MSEQSWVFLFTLGFVGPGAAFGNELLGLGGCGFAAVVAFGAASAAAVTRWRRERLGARNEWPAERTAGLEACTSLNPVQRIMKLQLRKPMRS